MRYQRPQRSMHGHLNNHAMLLLLSGLSLNRLQRLAD